MVMLNAAPVPLRPGEVHPRVQNMYTNVPRREMRCTVANASSISTLSYRCIHIEGRDDQGKTSSRVSAEVALVKGQRTGEFFLLSLDHGLFRAFRERGPSVRDKPVPESLWQHDRCQPRVPIPPSVSFGYLSIEANVSLRPTGEVVIMWSRNERLFRFQKPVLCAFLGHVASESRAEFRYVQADGTATDATFSFPPSPSCSTFSSPASGGTTVGVIHSKLSRMTES